MSQYSLSRPTRAGFQQLRERASVNIVFTTLFDTGTKNLNLRSQMTMSGASFFLQSFLYTQWSHRHQEPSQRSLTMSPNMTYRLMAPSMKTIANNFYCPLPVSYLSLTILVSLGLLKGRGQTLYLISAWTPTHPPPLNFLDAFIVP